jgi:hypothetical protein
VFSLVVWPLFTNALPNFPTAVDVEDHHNRGTGTDDSRLLGARGAPCSGIAVRRGSGAKVGGVKGRKIHEAY